jgi:hypothetical protein
MSSLSVSRTLFPCGLSPSGMRAQQRMRSVYILTGTAAVQTEDFCVSPGSLEANSDTFSPLGRDHFQQRHIPFIIRISYHLLTLYF